MSQLPKGSSAERITDYLEVNSITHLHVGPASDYPQLVHLRQSGTLAPDSQIIMAQLPLSTDGSDMQIFFVLDFDDKLASAFFIEFGPPRP